MLTSLKTLESMPTPGRQRQTPLPLFMTSHLRLQTQQGEARAPEGPPPAVPTDPRPGTRDQMAQLKCLLSHSVQSTPTGLYYKVGRSTNHFNFKDKTEACADVAKTVQDCMGNTEGALFVGNALAARAGHPRGYLLLPAAVGAELLQLWGVRSGFSPRWHLSI